MDYEFKVDFNPPENESNFDRAHRLFRSRLEYLRKKGRITLPEVVSSTLDFRDSNFMDQLFYLSVDFVELGVDEAIVKSSDDRRLNFLYQKYQELKLTLEPKKTRSFPFNGWQSSSGWERCDHSAYSTA